MEFGLDSNFNFYSCSMANTPLAMVGALDEIVNNIDLNNLVWYCCHCCGCCSCYCFDWRISLKLLFEVN